MKTPQPGQLAEKRSSANAGPEVSLVVALFNQREWLPGFFESIQKQVDPPRYEVIFCDDGSSDGSLQAAQSLAEQYGVAAQFVWQADRGFRLSRSKNNGLHCAKGHVVIFSDGDISLAPTYLDDHWQAHQVPGRLVCGSVYTKIAAEPVPGCIWPQDGSAPVEGATREPPDPKKWLGSRWEWVTCIGGNFSVERERCLPFDENFCSWGSEDRDIAYRLIESGLQVFLLPQPNAIQWKPPGSGWTNMSHDKVVALLENKAYLASKYPSGELAPSVNLVRRCHLSADGRWSIGPTREDASTVDIFREFQDWKKS